MIRIRIDCKEEESRAMRSAMEEHLRTMSLTALAEQCLREINADLLFHCGLQPQDIVRLYPQEVDERQTSPA